MKAIRVEQFGGPEVLKWTEVADPKPGPGQVLVRILAAGVNPVDTYLHSGNYPVKPPLPYTPGTDGAGEVAGLGPGTTVFKTGDRVYVDSAPGTYAEFCLVPENQVHPLPPSITFAQGAALAVPYVTAHRALFHRGQAAKDEKVLVHGASGGVGVAAVQLAKAAGLEVFATAGTPRGLQLIQDQGADHGFDHHDPNYLQKLSGLTGGIGLDVIVEMAAHVNLGKDLPMLSKKGRVVVVGSRGPVEINPRDLMGRDGDIRGMTIFNATAEEKRAIHRDLVEGLKKGSLKPVVGKEFKMSEAALAHEEVMKPGAYGKIVLVP